jgi:type I restriction enzyme R subunit
LISLTKDGKAVFDSVIVITDRRILDKQIRETIKGFAQVGSIIGAVKEGAGTSKTEQLTKYLKDGKKLIISTVQTFPFVLDSIGDEHRGGKFAIIIDEAHSSQSGRTSSAVSQAVADSEDEINDAEDDRTHQEEDGSPRMPATLPSPRRRRTRRWRCSAFAVCRKAAR